MSIFIFQKAYDVVRSLEAINEMPSGSPERAKAYAELRQTEVCVGSATFAGIFALVFDGEPCDPEKEQFEVVYHELFKRGSIHSETPSIFTMVAGMADDTSFSKTRIFQHYFGDTDTINDEQIKSFKAQIGRAELDLCKLGVEFCSKYGHYNQVEYGNFWDRIVVDKSFVKPLYLSNGALRQLSARRIATRPFTHLSEHFNYLDEQSLSKIPVRYGKINPNAVTQWLYGQTNVKESIADLTTKIIEKVCERGNQLAWGAWEQLLSTEFGQECGNALDHGADILCHYPIGMLQEEIRKALRAIDAEFLRQRHKCRV